MKFINIHGTKSSGKNGKYNWIKFNYSKCDIFSPDIDYIDANAINILNQFNNKVQFYKNKDKTIIFGSSLGGFFGYILSVMNPEITTLLFNPSLVPFSRLNSKYKMNYENISIYSSLFAKYMLNFTNDFEETAFGKNLHIFIGKNDNIVNFKNETKGILPNNFENIYTFESDHQMLITTEIGNKIKEIIKNNTAV